jgi:hypothetical protein
VNTEEESKTPNIKHHMYNDYLKDSPSQRQGRRKLLRKTRNSLMIEFKKGIEDKEST